MCCIELNRGSLRFSPEAFSHKIIKTHATKNSSL
nr:MAG TPA: hypothetical protein [Caudoviricetes sp.]